MEPGRLAHIGMATPPIEESARYYRDVMGAGHSPPSRWAQG